MHEMQIQPLGWEDNPAKGNGSPFQYYCLGKPMDRGAWRAAVHRVTRVRHKLVPKQQNSNVILIANRGDCQAAKCEDTMMINYEILLLLLLLSRYSRVRICATP